MQQIHLNYLKKSDSKTVKATGDMIANKIANAVTKISKNSQQSHSEAVTNENDKKVIKN